MNVLCLTNILPFKQRTGGEICSNRLVAQLAQTVEQVIVAGRGEETELRAAPPAIEALPLAAVEKEFALLSTAEKASAMVHAMLTGKALSVSRMSADNVAHKLSRAMAQRPLDAVLIDHLQMFEVLRMSRLEQPAILIAHNVEPDVYRALFATATSRSARFVLAREAAKLAELDAEALKRVRAVGCLTESDATYYRELSARMNLHRPVHVLPSYFDPSSSALPEPSARSGLRRIGIIGTWTWESNRLGLEWFLREVLPHLDSQHEVVIAGKGLTQTPGTGGVRYLGFVDSVDRFYAECDVIAIPSTYGSGVQEKTIEALGRSTPVVATPVAMRGLSSHPPHVRVEASPEAFAKACMQRAFVDRQSIRAAALAWNDARQKAYAESLTDLLLAATRK